MAGASPESIEAFKKQRQPVQIDFEVWEENWPSVTLFLELGTQWRILSGMNGDRWIGIDYQAIQAVMNIKGVSKAKRIEQFADLQLMEREALTVINKPKKE